jgi:hypothetical protein
MDFHEVRPGQGRVKSDHERASPDFASPDIEEKCYTKR